jgi:hypothetical protein
MRGQFLIHHLVLVPPAGKPAGLSSNSLHQHAGWSRLLMRNLSLHNDHDGLSRCLAVAATPGSGESIGAVWVKLIATSSAT